MCALERSPLLTEVAQLACFLLHTYKHRSVYCLLSLFTTESRKSYHKLPVHMVSSLPATSPVSTISLLQAELHSDLEDQKFAITQQEEERAQNRWPHLKRDEPTNGFKNLIRTFFPSIHNYLTCSTVQSIVQPHTKYRPGSHYLSSIGSCNFIPTQT